MKTLPVNYLRWLLTQSEIPPEILAIAKEKVDASIEKSEDYIDVSRHALDKFSLMFLDRWKNDSRGLGLGSYVARIAQEAFEIGKDISKRRHKDDGLVRELNGIRYVYKQSKEYPEYLQVITIMDDRPS